LNTDFSVEISFSEMTPPLREAAPWPTGEAVCVHDARARLTTAAAITRAGHDLSRSRQATRIPIRFPSPHQHDTTTAYGANTFQASWLPRGTHAARRIGSVT
jgi:hypothetical protein